MVYVACNTALLQQWYPEADPVQHRHTTLIYMCSIYIHVSVVYLSAQGQFDPILALCYQDFSAIGYAGTYE